MKLSQQLSCIIQDFAPALLESETLHLNLIPKGVNDYHDRPLVMYPKVYPSIRVISFCGMTVRKVLFWTALDSSHHLKESYIELLTIPWAIQDFLFSLADNCLFRPNNRTRYGDLGPPFKDT